jgi:hypothetical protein
MKKFVSAILLIALAIGFCTACKKNKVAPEPSLFVTTTPANKSNNLNLLGPDFPLTVEITSAIPAKGVKIEVAATKEGSSDPAFFTATSTSTAPQNNYTITNTPSGNICVVTVTVTSVSQASNKWVGSYRYSKK